MKSIVIYFSQTGNTKKVAEVIQGVITSATGQCDIVKLKEVNINELAGYDLIGLGCPCFAHVEPENVKRFIEDMGPLKGKPCFIFSTHGGHPYNIFPSMAGKLRKQGLKVIGSFNCDGSDHMPKYTSPWFTYKHPDEIDLKAAADFGREIVAFYQRLSRGEKVLLPTFPWPKNSLHRDFIKTAEVNKPRSQDFAFKMTLDKGKCRYPKCHLCVDNCPVDAIDLSVDPLIFRKGCITCYFCEMICPTGAIEFDPESVEARRKATVAGVYSRKYPEFFERAKTELIGNRSTLYRMLMDKVSIDNTDKYTMYGKDHSKRPRYVIRG